MTTEADPAPEGADTPDGNATENETNVDAAGAESPAGSDAVDPEGAGEGSASEGEAPENAVDSAPDVSSAEFQELESDAPTTDTSNPISRLNDLKIEISAELGTTDLSIQELLRLGNGSVLELDRPIDAPVHLVAQGVKLAEGEVVVSNNCFAIKITQVIQTIH